MAPLQAVMQGVITIFFYAMAIAVVWKVFMVAADVGEMKKLLTDIRSNTAAHVVRTPEVPTSVPAAAVPVAAAPVAAAPAPPPIAAGPISLESAEALLREIEAEERALAAQPAKPVAS